MRLRLAPLPVVLVACAGAPPPAQCPPASPPPPPQAQAASPPAAPCDADFVRAAAVDATVDLAPCLDPAAPPLQRAFAEALIVARAATAEQARAARRLGHELKSSRADLRAAEARLEALDAQLSEMRALERSLHERRLDEGDAP